MDERDSAENQPWAWPKIITAGLGLAVAALLLFELLLGIMVQKAEEQAYAPRTPMPSATSLTATPGPTPNLERLYYSDEPMLFLPSSRKGHQH